MKNRKLKLIGVVLTVLCVALIVSRQYKKTAFDDSITISDATNSVAAKERVQTMAKNGNRPHTSEKSTFAERVKRLKEANSLADKRIQLNGLISDYTTANPEGVIDSIAKYSSPDYRDHDMLRVFQILGSEGLLEKGLELTEKLDPGKVRSDIIKAFWMAATPIPDEIFLRAIGSVEFPEDRGAMIDALLRTSPKNDALLKAVVSTDSSPEAQYIGYQLKINDLVDGGGATVGDILAMMNKFDKGSADKLWAHYITRISAKQGIPDAIKEIEAKSSDVGNKRVESSCLRLVNVSLSQSPEKGVEALNVIQDPLIRSQAIKMIAEVWIDKNSIEASKWAGTLNEADRKIAAKQIVDHLRRTGDVKAAELWSQSAK